MNPLHLLLRPRMLGCVAGVLSAFALALLGWHAWVRAEDYATERLSVTNAASPTLLDRNGQTLWRSGGASGEQRDWVQLARVAPIAVRAFLAAEDHRFYEHSGVDPLGVLRALLLNLKGGSQGYGASTISMQLVRLVEPEHSTRSWSGKLRQALHAARLERILSKAQILEQYLNRAYFGNGAFGIEAASELYFGTSAATLSAAQAAFLAALPRAPRGYDPYTQRQKAEQRQRHILARMSALGWLSDESLQVAQGTPLVVRKQRESMRARHFVDHLLTTLPEAQMRGKRVTTTLDLRLQALLEVALRRHLDAIGGRDVSQAGMLVVDNRSGDILAMVGSRNYEESEQQGALNVTTVRRRPGSTLKPFVYGLALELGDSPATLAYDVILPGEAHEPYSMNVKQHGPARYREALAGSYNLAAVHTLQRVGVRALVQRLRRAGLSTLDEPDASYGPGLAIGEAEFELLEYAGAFASFGNAGLAIQPRAVLRSVNAETATWGATAARPFAEHAEPARSVEVFSPQIAYQVFDMLSDADARRPMFGLEAPMDLPFPVALKTGTTRGYTDNLAFGTTREFTVGVWAGNFDGSPMQGVIAMQGAAPLVRAAFVALASLYGDPSAPARPPELVEREVCPLSGARPNANCPGRKRELFTANGLRNWEASPSCTFHVDRGGHTAVVYPDILARWAAGHDPGWREPFHAQSDERLAIVYPRAGSRFQLDPERDAMRQIPPLRASPKDDRVRFRIDGMAPERWKPTPGKHSVSAHRGTQHDEIEIFYQ